VTIDGLAPSWQWCRKCEVLEGGSGGGSLQTGPFFDFPGRAHNGLLISLCYLMGLADVDTFSDPDYCSGPLEL